MTEPNQSSLLIVDDDKINREILYRHLRILGYTNIALAESAKKGLEIINSQAIDLILLDMIMPVMNGLEMLDYLKADQKWRTIPIIIISGLNEKEMMFSCIEKGAEDYLIKPYDHVLLKSRVSACLDKKMLHDHEVLNKQKLEAAYKELEVAYSKLEIIKNELDALSHRDGLTGVANRRHFDTVLEKEWNAAKREKKSLSLILFDIDYFKKYNDTYGHVAGDDCLCQIATVASQVIKRPRDTLARYGGEEFAVILPDTNPLGTSVCAERIRYEIENLNVSHISSKTSPYVTASLGISTISPHLNLHQESAIALVKEADLALYQAKEEGRNCVKVWSSNE